MIGLDCRCWTRNKFDKLRLFRLCSMWFVTEEHSAQLGELGRLDGGADEAADLKRLAAGLWDAKSLSFAERFEIMTSKICLDPTATPY